VTNLSETTLLAYVDGELEPGAAEEVSQWLAHDRAAAEMVRTLRSSAALVRAAFADPEWQNVPADLQACVEGRRGLRWLAGRRQFVAALGASLAACAAGVAAGIAFERPWPKQAIQQADQQADPGARLLDEVAEYHADLAGEASRLAIAPAGKAAAIESWFAHVLGRPVRIPDLRPFGLAFQGARLLVLDDRPVAQFLYAAAGSEAEPLGVCVTAWPAPAVPLRTEQQDGLALALWARRGFAYVLVGWVRPALLKKVAVALEPELEQS